MPSDKISKAVKPRRNIDSKPSFPFSIQSIFYGVHTKLKESKEVSIRRCVLSPSVQGMLTTVARAKCQDPKGRLGWEEGLGKHGDLTVGKTSFLYLAPSCRHSSSAKGLHRTPCVYTGVLFFEVWRISPPPLGGRICPSH